MPRSEEEIRSDIERADEDYTEAYLPEAATYYDYGIYDSMADLLHTPAGGTHLNVCSGPFYIEEAIQRAHPEVAIAGIDLNREMLMAAQRVLTQLRANYRTHINGTLNFSSFLVNEYDEPLFHWSYPKDFKDIPDFLTPGGPIEMIQGDVTEESLIQAILMGRQLDSASFSFLGSSPTNLMEATAQISALDEEEHYKKRVNQHWQSIALKIYELLSKHVRPGGEMVVGERFPDKYKPIKDMKRNIRYWEPIESMETSAPHENSPFGIPITIVRFVRNSIPFAN